MPSRDNGGSHGSHANNCCSAVATGVTQGCWPLGLGSLAAVGAVCLPSQPILLPSWAAGEGGTVSGSCWVPQQWSFPPPHHISGQTREGHGVRPFLLSFFLHPSIWLLMDRGEQCGAGIAAFNAHMHLLQGTSCPTPLPPSSRWVFPTHTGRGCS